MGGSSSRPEPERDDNSSHENQDNSSGFHFVEIHLQSAGFSFLTFVLIGLVVWAVWYWCRRQQRLQIAAVRASMGMHGPMNFPMQDMRGRAIAHSQPPGDVNAVNIV